MKKTADTLAGGEGDLLSLLSGCGTPQVDVVFYVILHRKSLYTPSLSRTLLYPTDVYRA